MVAPAQIRAAKTKSNLFGHRDERRRSRGSGSELKRNTPKKKKEKKNK